MKEGAFGKPVAPIYSGIFGILNTDAIVRRLQILLDLYEQGLAYDQLEVVHVYRRGSFHLNRRWPYKHLPADSS